ncbi:hypothetical protein BBJ28_00016105 [Nothophytophthora sp. Chile5]|nr:hypothetical protein BBJ28_00016105 [Nothophytophthora sp. Chile5]
MDALWEFLNEFDLVMLENGAISADDAVASGDGIMVSFKPDEDSERLSPKGDDAHEAIAPHIAKRGAKSEFERERQHKYDKKSREKKTGNRLAISKAFVKGLKLLSTMLEGRVEVSYTARDKLRTARAGSLALKLAIDASVPVRPEALGYSRGNERICQEDAEKQLAVNQSVMVCVEKWVAEWAQHTRDIKNFLKSWAADIRIAMARLENLGTQLKEVSAELLKCVLNE